jgi:hypothetical protein
MFFRIGAITGSAYKCVSTTGIAGRPLPVKEDPTIGKPDGWFLSVALPPYRDTVSHYIYWDQGP